MQENRSPQFELSGIAGEYIGQQIPFSTKPIIIGKDPQQAGLIISDQQISRRHCEIGLKDGVAYVQDFDSTNGTWVNEQRLTPQVVTLLRPGDTVSVAGCEVFQVTVSTAPSVPSTPMPQKTSASQESPVNPPLAVAPHLGQSIDARKLVDAVLGLGGLITCGALVWWAYFYGSVVQEFGGNLWDARVCLYSSGGPCALVTGLAQLGGVTPYHPATFWVGGSLLAIGVILRIALRPNQ